MNVAIVDYGMGNLFSVQQACRSVGLDALITSNPNDVRKAAAVILPGVGAFGQAMETLEKKNLAAALKDVAVSGKPFLGICLGMQLLMGESQEFGSHKGLGLVEGNVIRLAPGAEKVPQVGWNRVQPAPGKSWSGSALEGIPEGVHMYFVHSFHVVPKDRASVLGVSRYGQVEFCSVLCQGSLTAYQFHPERSGPQGLKLYAAFAARVKGKEESRHG